MATGQRKPSVTLYLDPKQHMEFKLASVQEGRSMADIGRELLDAYLKAWKKDNTVSPKAAFANPSPSNENIEKIREIRQLFEEIFKEEN